MMVDASIATWGWQDVQGIVTLGGLLIVALTGGLTIGKLQQKVLDLTEQHSENIKRIEAIGHQLNEHALNAERRFVNSDVMHDLKSDIMKAIDSLGERLDTLVRDKRKPDWHIRTSCRDPDP